MFFTERGRGEGEREQSIDHLIPWTFRKEKKGEGIFRNQPTFYPKGGGGEREKHQKKGFPIVEPRGKKKKEERRCPGPCPRHPWREKKKKTQKTEGHDQDLRREGEKKKKCGIKIGHALIWGKEKGYHFYV